MKIGSVDLGILLVYLIGILVLGLLAGLRRHAKTSRGRDYFLAGNTLRWPVIGLAMFAANISTVHLVSLAQSAYKYGLVYGNFEWMAGFTLVLLSLFFAPLYLRAKVPTLPDYLERRFNRPCRDLLAFFSLVSAIVIHIGVALYTAAWVLCGVLDIDPQAQIFGISVLMLIIIALGTLTGIYTLYGGLLAVVWTESVQSVILFVGAIIITCTGLWKVGGWTALAHTLNSHPHPLAGLTPDIPAKTTRFLHIIRQPGDPGDIPWYSVLLGYPVLGIWYWCCDQTIVQRVLAARDDHEARLGPLFCAFLKIFPVFIFVLPGVICVALVQQGQFAGAVPHASADTYTFLITHLLPTGLKGLVIAAMLSAAMQTCSAALNSSATLVAYDLVKRRRPATTDGQLVMVGKIATVMATILAIVLSPIFGHYDTLIEGINKMISYIAPPVTAAFLLGIFWKGASARAAFWTLIVGSILGFTIFVLDWYKIYRGDFMLTGFYLFVICVVLMTVLSFVFPEALKEEARDLVWQDWRESLRLPAPTAWWKDFRVLSCLVVATFVGLYVAFR